MLPTYQRLPRPLLDANHPDGVGGHERSRRRGVAVHRGQRTFITLRSHEVVSLYQRLTAKRRESVTSGKDQRHERRRRRITHNSSSKGAFLISREAKSACARFPIATESNQHMEGFLTQYFSSATSPNITLDSYWSRGAQPAPSCSVGVCVCVSMAVRVCACVREQGCLTSRALRLPEAISHKPL